MLLPAMTFSTAIAPRQPLPALLYLLYPYSRAHPAPAIFVHPAHQKNGGFRPRKGSLDFTAALPTE